MHRLFAQKQNLFWEAKVDDSRGNPRKLWRTLSKVLGKEQKSSTPSKELTADDFLKAFSEKTDTVRQSTSSAAYPKFDEAGCPHSLLEFESIDCELINQLIQSSPNKNCTLDPVPTWMIKQYASELVPFITVYCNTSLRDGSFPDSQKNAIVTPILKKANLDAPAAANYRPISNLSYLSKLLERCVNKQLNDYLSTNNLLPSVQSAYRKFHSTESAVLKVLSDIYAAADEKMVSLLGLLDLSAAFDTVDHQILFDRLRYEYGLDGSVLSWFKSYLTNRTICVHYNGQTSETVFILYGVPQGSVLGPILFILYVAGAINIADKHGFAAHSYADDLQIYDHSPQSSCSSLVVRMSNCVAEINKWMGSNRLKLNPSKTELIWLGSSRRLEHCPVGELNIAGVPIKPATHVRDLGVMIDNDLSLQAHINHVTQTCFYHLRQLRVVRRSLTTDTAHSLVRALVHSRLDYCNGVLAGMFQYQIDRLQSVLRAAARLVLGLPKWASVSDAMHDKLHWLPFPERVEFKLCSVVYKCLHESAPRYLSQYCIPVASLPGRSHLRSAASGDLFVPATSTKTIGPRGFFHAGPAAWNCLPSSLKDPNITFSVFKKLLKTELFQH